jgi:RNA polymerase sigma-70 factor (ECF subfamily)
VNLPPLDPETLERHVAFVRSVARAALGGDAEVEDVAQDAWVAALQGAPSRPHSMRAWLGVVTRRQAALRIRRRTRERSRVEEVARRRAAQPDRGEAAADAVVRAETGRRVVGAVLGLPEEYRSVLLLRYSDGLPPRKVAMRLGIPVETVRTRTRRGLERLRERLDATERRRGSDWRASLLLLVPDRSLGVSTTLWASVGAVLMKKSLLSVALIILVLGGALLSWRRWLPEDPQERASAAADLSGTLAVGKGEGERGPAHLAGMDRPVRSSDEGLPPPVDMAVVDRERDLHGVVLDDASGQPVAGAKLELIVAPWGRASAFESARQQERHSVAATRSASDGTWLMRLEPGDAGDLHVRAAGYAAHCIRSAQAGERLDLRLGRGSQVRICVVDSAGEVLPEAHIRVFQAGGDTRDGHGFTTMRGVTDGNGLYVASGLPAGIAVTIDASHPLQGAAAWHELRAAARGTVDVEIQIPESRVLTGRVTDERSGAPVAGARVGIGWRLDAAVRTNDEGWYELPGWTGQGVYEIAVRAQGYAQAEALVQARSRLDFALVPDVPIRGRIVDADRRAVPGVLISAIGSSHESGRQVTSSGSACSDDAGRFEVRGLRRDMPHRLILVARGYGRTLHDVPLLASDLGDLQIAPAGQVSGVLVRPDGTPLQRVPVLLGIANNDREARLEGAAAPEHDYGLEEERYTDDLGRFRFRDVALGRYMVDVNLPNTGAVADGVVLTAASPTAHVRLVVGRGRPFIVRVEEVGGTPLDRVLVSLTTAGHGQLTDRTDASGRARFELLGAPATVSVEVDGATAAVRYLESPCVEVPPGEREVLVQLERAEVIRGRIVDEQGAAIAGAVLRAMRAGETLAEGSARGDGTFRLMLPAGAQVDLELLGTRMEDVGSGFISKMAFLRGGLRNVSAGDEGLVLRAETVAMTATATVVVTDPEGRPLANAMVYVTRAGEELVTVAPTGTEGRITLEGLPDVELEFAAARAPAAEAEDWAVPARIDAVPRAQTITLRYRPAAHVRGLVVDADGLPAAGIRLVADYGESAYHMTTDSEGRFDACVPSTVDEVTLRLHRPDKPGARSGAVLARPGDSNVRLRIE